jgi:hypothetical protein
MGLVPARGGKGSLGAEASGMRPADQRPGGRCRTLQQPGRDRTDQHGELGLELVGLAADNWVRWRWPAGRIRRPATPATRLAAPAGWRGRGVAAILQGPHS